jgi:hypothetical protein
MNEGFFSSPRREEGANRDSQPTSNAGIGKKTRSLHKFSREAAESSWFSKKSEYVICKAGYTSSHYKHPLVTTYFGTGSASCLREISDLEFQDVL